MSIVYRKLGSGAMFARIIENEVIEVRFEDGEGVIHRSISQFHANTLVEMPKYLKFIPAEEGEFYEAFDRAVAMIRNRHEEIRNQKG